MKMKAYFTLAIRVYSNKYGCHNQENDYNRLETKRTILPWPIVVTMCMAVHMVAARLGCKRRMVGTRLANSRPGFMNRLRKLYCHLVGGSSLAGRAAWELSRWLQTDNADYCMVH